MTEIDTPVEAIVEPGEPVELTGGCQCGAVRYRVAAIREGANLCHCRMCQKASGGPFMAFAPVALADFMITRGAIATFRSSEIADRGFCPACGTPLTYQGVGKDYLSVTIGSLDTPAVVAPTEQLAAEAAVPWLWVALGADNVPLEGWRKEAEIDDVGSRQHPDHEI
jgi:hypothetical protein